MLNNIRCKRTIKIGSINSDGHDPIVSRREDERHKLAATEILSSSDLKQYFLGSVKQLAILKVKFEGFSHSFTKLGI